MGILDIPYNQNWFRTIDLRVIEPGIVGNSGQTQPYQVKPRSVPFQDADYELQTFLKFHPDI